MPHGQKTMFPQHAMRRITEKQARAAGGVIGAIAAWPAVAYGFIIGGMFFGVISGGLLAIPGALLGAALAIGLGALLGRIGVKIGYFTWRSWKSRPPL